MPRVGFLKALWFSIIGFIENLFFNKSPSSSLPLPVTARVKRHHAPISASATGDVSPPVGPPLRSTPPATVMDRSTVSEVVSPGDIPRLPSPWSPVGRPASSDVWMSVDGLLVNASGPVTDSPVPSQDDSLAVWTTLSRMSTTASSALDALGIFDQAQDDPVDPRDDPTTHVPKWTRAATLGTPPRKRRETISSVPHAGARAAKCLSTPLTKLDHVGVNHVRSATSISSMAYEFRMGLFADGRSMSALISLLDQASPHEEPTQPVVVC